MSAIITHSFHKDLFVVAQSKLDAMTDSELTALVKETNGKTLQAAKQTLLHVAQTGLVLITLKEKRGHGNFMKEVELWTGISQRTANNYMAITRHYRNVSNLKNVSEALKYLKEASAAARRRDERSSPPKIATPSPAPSKPALPLGATYQDAEIAEPSAPITLEAEIVEPHPPTPATVSDKLPKWIPDDAERLWLIAKTDLDKILPNDKSRERVLNEIIAYCHGRLDQKRDALAAIIGTLPRLTKDEIKSLIETLNTRWT